VSGLFQEFQLVSCPFASVQSHFLLLPFLVAPSTATTTTAFRPVVLLRQVLGVVPVVVISVFLVLVRGVLIVGLRLVLVVCARAGG